MNFDDNKIMRKGALLGVLMLLGAGLVMGGCGSSGGSGNKTYAPLTGDYGDAPDGEATGYPSPFEQQGDFPSLLASNGARTADTTDVKLGPDVTDENDSIQSGDLDDGIVSLYTTLTQLPPPTTMTVNVTADAAAQGGQYYLNALIDLDMDGSWGGKASGGESEWVVQNYPVTVTPGAVTPVTPPAFAFTNGNRVPNSAWMRVALTKEMVKTNWDGTGEFSTGEIEDHIIEMPLVDGKEVPMLTVDCGGPYDFGDKTQINVTCDVTNMRDVAGNFSYQLLHEPNGGGVGVGNCLPASPQAIGALGTKQVLCTATKGETPDSWTFKATAIDPPSVVKDDGSGIIWGHDESALAIMTFQKAAVLNAIFVATMTTTFVHTKPGEYSELYVRGKINMALANAVLLFLITDPFGAIHELQATTVADGSFEAALKIYSYGVYQVVLSSILADAYQYDSQQNQVDTEQEVNVQ